jgi:16S rRNA (uracil1498-N3)-methyltransferase
MNLFFAPAIQTGAVLPEPESQHCVRVLRCQKGDRIRITDGKGRFFNARIIENDPKHCLVEIVETVLQPPLWKGRIEIAVAPTKNRERIEWFAEKATEIGIDKITFLLTRFSERKEIRMERLNQILVAAMKQSGKAVLPELQALTDFDSFVKQEFDGRKLIAHCYESEKESLSLSIGKDDNVLILIGPEGDFSEEEIALATGSGFLPVSLSNSRLRTETAALVACQTVHAVRQILSHK